MNCRGRKSPEKSRNTSEAQRAAQFAGLYVALWAMVYDLLSPSAYADGNSCTALRAIRSTQKATSKLTLQVTTY